MDFFIVGAAFAAFFYGCWRCVTSTTTQYDDLDSWDELGDAR